MIAATQVNYSVSLGMQTLSILQDISLQIYPGQSVAIIGRSGSGKTTLLGLLAGLDSPASGQLWLAGAELTAMTEDQRAQLRAEKVGFVFQSFQLLPTLTALENVMLPLELNGHTDPHQHALTLLNRVGLSERLNHTPRQLSGGEQQRVAIARAFAVRPAVLFADEPTGNLDSATGEIITDLLMELNAEHGTTLVMVTHDPALAERCDRQVHIEAGRLIV